MHFPPPPPTPTLVLSLLKAYADCVHYTLRLRIKESNFNFIFCGKSILYVKITVSQKILFQNSVLNIIQAFYLHTYNNVTKCEH